MVNRRVLSVGDRCFNASMYVILGGFAILCIFPLMYVVSVSLTPYSEVLRNGGFVVIPRNITLDAYRLFLDDSRILNSYGVTIFITVVGTAINIPLTILLAYPLSKKDLPGGNGVMFFVLFTMLFNGGMIPRYLIVKAFGLIDSIWSLIIPIAIAPYNVILMRTFFRSLPTDLFEAAFIDGAGRNAHSIAHRHAPGHARDHDQRDVLWRYALEYVYERHFIHHRYRSAAAPGGAARHHCGYGANGGSRRIFCSHGNAENGCCGAHGSAHHHRISFHPETFHFRNACGCD